MTIYAQRLIFEAPDDFEADVRADAIVAACKSANLEVIADGPPATVAPLVVLDIDDDEEE